MIEQPTISTTLGSSVTGAIAPLHPSPSNVTDSGPRRPSQHPCANPVTPATARRTLPQGAHIPLSTQIRGL